MVYKADSNCSGGLAQDLDGYHTVGTKMNSIQNKSPRHSAKHEEIILAVHCISYEL